MSTPTPEDRLSTVERHTYTVQALGEVLTAVSTYAHLSDRSDIGFLIGFLSDRLTEEADAILKAAATFPPKREQLP